jgi:hypothetical protein
MKRILGLTLTIAAGAALAGCVATDLSQLETRYTVLNQQKQTTDSNPLVRTASAEVTVQGERDDVQAGFATLAKDSLAVAGDADNPATKISAYKLAAVAAWKGGTSYIEATEKGGALCAAGKTSVAPRDCAILVYVPTFATYDQVAREANAAPVKTVDLVRKLLNEAQTMLPPQTTNLPQIMNPGPSSPYAGIASSTQTYIAKFTLAAACQTESLMRAVQAMPDQTPGRIDLYNDLVKASANYQDLLTTAGFKWRNPANWYAEGRC